MSALDLPANRHCSVARSLELLGQKWNLLLLREAFFGRTRFAQFRRIGIPPATLGARLDALVDAGLMQRRQYRDPGERTREEYLLTDAGRDALSVLAALGSWGDAHRPLPDGPSIEYRTSDGTRAHLAFVDDDGRVLDRTDVHPQPTPAYTRR
ncbi:winged helix-turn-helix transcriptional regulator [Microbacterium sp. RD1]|uniref:winged helix-turn-helix transcriptional regulator n=1 Tax=Microbacterium sp. RD1 TaxID=3457313 RepID=UPI003FA52D29